MRWTVLRVTSNSSAISAVVGHVGRIRYPTPRPDSSSNTPSCPRSTATNAHATGKDPVWVVAALLAQHLLTPAWPRSSGVAGFGSGQLTPSNSEDRLCRIPRNRMRR